MQPHPTSPKPFPKMVYVLLFLVLILFAFVILVMTVPIKPHFPPEDPEITAKRLSPENGFYAIEEAADLMKPLENLAPWRYASEKYEQIWKSAWTVDPEKEAALLAYFERAEPAIEKIREGLNAEYFLMPEIGNANTSRWVLDFLTPLRQIARILTAEAKYLESQGKYAEAMQNYLDTVRFAMMVRSDGPLLSGYIGIAMESVALDGLNRSLNHYEDKQIIQHALDTLVEIAQFEPPSSRVFEFEFRLIENSPLFGAQSVPSAQGPGTPLNSGEIFFGRAFSLIFHRSRERYYREFLEAIDKPYLEYQNNPPQIPRDPWSKIVFPALSRSEEAFARKKALLEGTTLAIALRLHRIEQGAYPENLDSLVPTYLDALPIDPFTGNPFHYVSVGNDFLLYGYGVDGVDSGGTGNAREGDQIIHLPAEEQRGAPSRRTD